jgi:hypothetical protein
LTRSLRVVFFELKLGGKNMPKKDNEKSSRQVEQQNAVDYEAANAPTPASRQVTQQDAVDYESKNAPQITRQTSVYGRGRNQFFSHTPEGQRKRREATAADAAAAGAGAAADMSTDTSQDPAKTNEPNHPRSASLSVHEIDDTPAQLDVVSSADELPRTISGKQRAIVARQIGIEEVAQSYGYSRLWGEGSEEDYKMESDYLTKLNQKQKSPAKPKNNFIDRPPSPLSQQQRTVDVAAENKKAAAKKRAEQAEGFRQDTTHRRPGSS